MNEQLGFVFNADYCIGCMACEIACRNENNVDSSISWRTVTKISFDCFLSLSCNHCNSPECFRVCPENAFSKRIDGIVIVDTNLCNGCGICINACPYNAPQYDYKTQKVSKCHMCYPRLDQGQLPICVESCTTGALKMTNLLYYREKGAQLSIDGFPDIRITQPSIVFLPTKKKKRYFLDD